MLCLHHQYIVIDKLLADDDKSLEAFFSCLYFTGECVWQTGPCCDRQCMLVEGLFSRETVRGINYHS